MLWKLFESKKTDNKTKDRVLIKNVSIEYRQKRVPVAT